MQNWLRDGYLPPNLPLRREFDADFTTLKALQDASPDPQLPFGQPVSASSTTSRPSSPLPATSSGPSPWIPVPKVLLPPTSLLTQNRYFGPPALFFSTRGGSAHSTAIVDARGRSVLKGRMMWSSDGAELVDRSAGSSGPMGDVKRVEAFDTKDQRAVVVALRQGGLEAADMGDALFQPGDESRSAFPMFISPGGATARRKNYVWKLGSAAEDVSTPSRSQGGSSTPPSPASRSETVLVRKHANGLGKKKRQAMGDGEDSTPLSPDEDILYLGRNLDAVYMCERSVDSFRILRLSPAE